MPVIKSAHAPNSVATFSMTDIETHARSLLVRASQQAEQLLAAAQAEAENIKTQARADGKAAGLAEGKRDGVAQGKAEGSAAGRQQAFDAEQATLVAATQTLTDMTAAFDAERGRVIARAEAEVLPLALAIARKVTRRLGEIDPGVVEANVRDAVRLVSDPHDLRITVHPAQHAGVDARLPRLRQQWPTMTHVTIVTDAAVAAGGCVVNTAGGEIDADLDRQLDRLIEEIVGVVRA